MQVGTNQTLDASGALAEAIRAHGAGADAYEVLAWLKAWQEGWGGDSFDDWDGIVPDDNPIAA